MTTVLETLAVAFLAAAGILVAATAFGGCADSRRPADPSLPAGPLAVVVSPDEGWTDAEVALLRVSVEEMHASYATAFGPSRFAFVHPVRGDEVRPGTGWAGLYEPPHRIWVAAGSRLYLQALPHELVHLNYGDSDHTQLDWAGRVDGGTLSGPAIRRIEERRQ